MSDKYADLARMFDAAPYSSFLGIKVVELSHCYSKVVLVMRPEHMNSVGRVHGGLIMSLADQAFACATNTFGGVYVAIQFNTNFFASPKEGDTVYAECRVVHPGKTIAVVEVVITDSHGRLIARATGTSANIDRG